MSAGLAETEASLAACVERLTELMARALQPQPDARSEAARLVRALLTDAHAYAAEDFGALSRWAHVLAEEAYMHTAITQVILDQTRPPSPTGPTERTLRWRWEQIHALSHSTLLATSAEPTKWLADMAESLEWRTWTPSFPLVRERIHRLAVRGAWAAARFGPRVVERYLRVIVEGERPLHCFDAVLGATAIALASPRDGSAIVRGVERALRRRITGAPDADDRLVAEACMRSVYAAVHEPLLAEEKMLMRARGRPTFRPGSEDEARRLALFVVLDDEGDCAEIDRHGFMPAILALPTVARLSSPELFFPTVAMRDRLASRAN